MRVSKHLAQETLDVENTILCPFELPPSLPKPPFSFSFPATKEGKSRPSGEKYDALNRV